MVNTCILGLQGWEWRLYEPECTPGLTHLPIATPDIREEGFLACSGNGAPGCKCCGRNVALGEKNPRRLDTSTVLTGHSDRAWQFFDIRWASRSRGSVAIVWACVIRKAKRGLIGNWGGRQIG